MFRLSIVASVALFTTPALAEWVAEVEGPNVFGQMQVFALAELSNEDSFFAISCDSEKEMLAGWFYESKDDASGTLIDLIIQNDVGDRATFTAESQDRNENYDVFAILKDKDIRQAIEIISASNKKIELGLYRKSADYKHAGRLSAKGSTKAMNLVKKYCAHFFQNDDAAPSKDT